MSKSNQTNWHKVFQDILEEKENLRELSGKIITDRAREYEQQIKIDFIVHAQGDIPQEELKPIVRPFNHFRKKNLIEYKSTREVFNEKMFRRYAGRALDAETTENVDYQGETTLTIVTLHKPIQLLSKTEYKIEQIEKWKYKSSWIDYLDIYILVQSEMRSCREGEALALLQVLESDRQKQRSTWRNIFDQDLLNKEFLKKIASKLDKENYMSVIEEAKAEGKAEGRVEGKVESAKEIARRMLQKGCEVSFVVEVCSLSEEEVLKIKAELS